MEKKLLPAFSYMFKDIDNKFKIAILLFLNLPVYIINCTMSSSKTPLISSMFMPTSIISAIVVAFLLILSGFILQGYNYKTIKNVALSNEQTNEFLPRWEDDFFSFLKIGFIGMVGLMTVALASGLPIILSSLSVKIIPIPVFALLFIISIVPPIIYGLISPVLITMFSITTKFSAFFKWKIALNIIKEDFGTYAKVCLIVFLNSLLLNLVFGILVYFFKDFLIFNVIIIAILTTYLQLINMYLFGILGKSRTLAESFEFVGQSV